MKYTLTLYALFLVINSNCQFIDASLIKLHISNDSINTIANDPKIKIDFRVKNDSSSNFIFYRLNSSITKSQIGRMDLFCNPEKTGAGLMLFVYDEKLKPQTVIHWYVNDTNNPMTKERFDSLTNVVTINSLRATVILKTREVINFQQEIDLTEFHLEKGEYFIQLMYFSGKRVLDSINQEQLKNDKAQHNAKVFEGCIISNKINLTIK